MDKTEQEELEMEVGDLYRFVTGSCTCWVQKKPQDLTSVTVYEKQPLIGRVRANYPFEFLVLNKASIKYDISLGSWVLCDEPPTEKTDPIFNIWHQRVFGIFEIFVFTKELEAVTFSKNLENLENQKVFLISGLPKNYVVSLGK